jgi:hypothetical protein
VTEKLARTASIARVCASPASYTGAPHPTLRSASFLPPRCSFHLCLCLPFWFSVNLMRVFSLGEAWAISAGLRRRQRISWSATLVALLDSWVGQETPRPAQSSSTAKTPLETLQVPPPAFRLTSFCFLQMTVCTTWNISLKPHVSKCLQHARERLLVLFEQYQSWTARRPTSRRATHAAHRDRAEAVLHMHRAAVRVSSPSGRRWRANRFRLILNAF